MGLLGVIGGVLTPGQLAGLKYYVCCGIGNPRAFVGTAKVQGRGPGVGSMILADHDPYSPATVARLLGELVRLRAEVMLTSAKDWSKLARVRAWPCPVLVPRLKMGFSDEGNTTILTEQAFANWLLARCAAHGA